ncbi:redoxin domain-containing protein [Akkermansiaceae bacterium]|nr:redoxin domain-containing protein [Akkermansiaceae bacterium]
MRDAFEKLTEQKVTVFGISTDSVERQKQFSEAQKLPYQLLSDPNGAVAIKFGVPLIFGKKFAARRALLFKGGKLVWQDTKGATKTQGQDVLKAIQGC